MTDQKKRGKSAKAKKAVRLGKKKGAVRRKEGLSGFAPRLSEYRDTLIEN